MANAWAVRTDITNSDRTVLYPTGRVITTESDVPTAQRDRVVVYDDGGASPVRPEPAPG
jgi:hypothetical protein